MVALINRCIGGGFNWKGNFWEMTVVTLGMVFCDTGKVSTKEERLDCRSAMRSVTAKRAGDAWQGADLPPEDPPNEGRMGKGSGGVAWCISQVVKAHEDCPELQAVLDEYHKPVVLQDEMLGELTLDKDYDTFEGEIQWCGKV